MSGVRVASAPGCPLKRVSCTGVLQQWIDDGPGPACCPRFGGVTSLGEGFTRDGGVVERVSIACRDGVEDV
jgi:hypothetical protein